MTERVNRYDRGSTGKVETMADGGIRVPAFLTRTGVFTYTRGDNSKVRELRLPEEVFADDAVKSLRGVSVTDLHPDELVSPTNWKQYAVGHVENPRRDEKYVAASLVIHAETTRAAVLRGDRVEVSCGYTCTVDPTPGVTADGEEYDAIQRGIVHNHVAVGPREWGRAGPEVRMHLDARDAIEQPAAHRDGKEIDMSDKTKAVRVDGVDVELAVSVAPLIERVLADLDEQTKRADGATARADKAEGTAAAEKARADKAEAALAEASDPKRFDGRVRARVQLERDAARVIGPDDTGKEPTFDALSDDEVRRQVILAVDPEAKLDGKSGDFLVGAYEASVRAHRHHARSVTFDAGSEGVGQRDAEPSIEQVRADAIRERAARYDAQKGN
ncbi:MAG: DUF2213 domain-containing protein [Deltaproteobacteria bacterium]|nr:DUF2213 domain-containing protein [Deltaproteobacteria bacterium]